MFDHYKLSIVLVGVFTFQELVQCKGADDFTGCNSQKYSLNIYGEAVPNLLGDCSGRGQCVSNNTACLCEKGWTGRSAFINTEGIDCQVNTYVIRTFWGVVFVYSLFVQIKYVIPNFRYRWKSFVAMRAARNVSLTQVPLILAFFSYQLLNFPCITFLSLLSIINEEERIGVTFWSTILFCVAGIGYSITHFLFQTALMEMFLSHRYFAESGSALTLGKCVKYSSIFLDFVLGTKYVIPIIMYATEGGEVTDRTGTLWCTYLILQATSLYFTGIQAWYIRRNLLIELEKIYMLSKNVNFKVLADKLENLQTNGMLQSSIFGSIYIVILFFPFLWNRHDYFLPFVCFGAIAVGALMTKSHVEGPSAAITLSSLQEVDVSSANNTVENQEQQPKGSFEITEGFGSLNDLPRTPIASRPQPSI
uniref:Epidermal growth factor-like domain-containing protein n=1 Tax=Aplanochytrium stocchinoi TaxID=215587 RepID=A0A7S3PDP2_9STRA